ncbi:MAG: hypothetical protein H6618_10195 [Deltaproteobacteria bacterium]|nr:hypothetical protein [Deltaproteobacteria bacterium]
MVKLLLFFILLPGQALGSEIILQIRLQSYQTKEYRTYEVNDGSWLQSIGNGWTCSVPALDSEHVISHADGNVTHQRAVGCVKGKESIGSIFYCSTLKKDSLLSRPNLIIGKGSGAVEITAACAAIE